MANPVDNVVIPLYRGSTLNFTWTITLIPGDITVTDPRFIVKEFFDGDILFDSGVDEGIDISMLGASGVVMEFYGSTHAKWVPGRKFHELYITDSSDGRSYAISQGPVLVHPL